MESGLNLYFGPGNRGFATILGGQQNNPVAIAMAQKNNAAKNAAARAKALSDMASKFKGIEVSGGRRFSGLVSEEVDKMNEETYMSYAQGNPQAELIRTRNVNAAKAMVNAGEEYEKGADEVIKQAKDPIFNQDAVASYFANEVVDEQGKLRDPRSLTPKYNITDLWNQSGGSAFINKETLTNGILKDLSVDRYSSDSTTENEEGVTTSTGRSSALSKAFTLGDNNKIVLNTRGLTEQEQKDLAAALGIDPKEASLQVINDAVYNTFMSNQYVQRIISDEISSINEIRRSAAQTAGAFSQMPGVMGEANRFVASNAKEMTPGEVNAFSRAYVTAMLEGKETGEVKDRYSLTRQGAGENNFSVNVQGTREKIGVIRPTTEPGKTEEVYGVLASVSPKSGGSNVVINVQVDKNGVPIRTAGTGQDGGTVTTKATVDRVAIGVDGSKYVRVTTASTPDPFDFAASKENKTSWIQVFETEESEIMSQMKKRGTFDDVFKGSKDYEIMKRQREANKIIQAEKAKTRK